MGLPWTGLRNGLELEKYAATKKKAKKHEVNGIEWKRTENSQLTGGARGLTKLLPALSSHG